MPTHRDQPATDDDQTTPRPDYAGTRGLAGTAPAVLRNRHERYRRMLAAPSPNDPPEAYIRSVLREIEDAGVAA